MDVTKGTDNEKEEKQILPMSILLTADELAEEYLFKDGIRLDLTECINLLKNKNEVSENERTYQYVIDEIIRNSFKFPSGADEVVPEQWGMIDEEKGQAVIIRTVFNDILRRGGFSDRTFLSWAARHGYIEMDPDGIHKDKKKRIHGTLTRCVFLNLPEEDFEVVDDLENIPFDDEGVPSSQCSQ